MIEHKVRHQRDTGTLAPSTAALHVNRVWVLTGLDEPVFTERNVNLNNHWSDVFFVLGSVFQYLILTVLILA